MSKGKHNRGRRTGPWDRGPRAGGDAVNETSTEPAQGDAPFEVDATTVETLGASGLAELAANLWPVDCQTCGRGLAPVRPVALRQRSRPLAYATLHHPRCRPPEWSIAPELSSDQHLSWTAQTYLLAMATDGQRADRPLMLVNPGLEQVGSAAARTVAGASTPSSSISSSGCDHPARSSSSTARCPT